MAPLAICCHVCAAQGLQVALVLTARVLRRSALAEHKAGAGVLLPYPMQSAHRRDLHTPSASTRHRQQAASSHTNNTVLATTRTAVQEPVGPREPRSITNSFSSKGPTLAAPHRLHGPGSDRLAVTPAHFRHRRRLQVQAARTGARFWQSYSQDPQGHEGLATGDCADPPPPPPRGASARPLLAPVQAPPSPRTPLLGASRAPLVRGHGLALPIQAYLVNCECTASSSRAQNGGASAVGLAFGGPWLEQRPCWGVLCCCVSRDRVRPPPPSLTHTCTPTSPFPSPMPGLPLPQDLLLPKHAKTRKHQQGVFREEFGREGGEMKKGTSLKNRIRSLKRFLAKPVCGRVGVWACGRVGVWACGRVGVWACGRVCALMCPCVGVCLHV